MRYLLIALSFLSITELFAGGPDRLEVRLISENNLCDDNLSPTGAAYAVIIEDNGKEDSNLKDYTVNWYTGTSASGTPAYVGPTYDQMAAGTYTVKVLHDKSSFTDQVIVTIDRTQEGPDAYVDEVKNAKNCKENDGRAKVRVRADFPQEGENHSHDDIKDCKHGICWTFVWYEGNNPFIGDVVAVGADAKDLKPGTYAVVVTNESTGCQTVVSLSVGLDAEVPEVGGTVVANITDCAEPNAGELSAFTNGSKNNNKFEFDWYIGDFVKEAPDFNNMETITGLAAGNYTVIATEKGSGCPSNPITLTVEDLTSEPVIAVNLDLEQTSCNAATPNGAVSATADGTTSGYDFEWFEGQNTLDENLIGTSSSISGLAAGFYTVRATNTSDPNSQNCFSTAEIEVTENLTFPTPVNASVTDQTYCVNPNGSIAANIAGNTTAYTFYWFDGNMSSPDINNPDFTGATYGSLQSGDYTLVVVNNNTSCASDPTVFTVDDRTSIPAIALASSTELTSCESPNGSISVTADGGVSGFAFRWFNGSSTASSDEVTPSPGADITGLTAGTYTVLVVNQTSGCSETFEHTVLDNTVTPVPATTIIDQTQCDPINGEIQANVGGVTAGYNFYWFDGNISSPDISSPDRSGATITGLTAGEYTLVVEDDFTKCVSAAQVLTVDDLTPVISGSISLVADQTSCDASAPNGALSVSASGGSSYTFEWFAGTDATGSSFASGSSVSGLSAQSYTVLITDASGCTVEVTAAVSSAIVLPEIDIDNIVANSICDPSLTSPAITNNGEIASSIGGTTAGYTFYWFDGDIASPDITSPDFTGDTYSNLASGDYTVVVVEDATTCESDRLVVTVPDATPTIGGTITLDAAQTSCDPTAPNGELTVIASGGSGPYTYAWYPGTDTSDPTDIIATTANATGLSAQTYTAVITDQSNGCSEEVSYTLPSNIQLPDIDIDNVISNSVCNTSTGASFNGEIASSIGGTTAGYTFYWFDGDIASPDITSPDFTGATYSNLQSGDYTVVVVEDATTCESDRLVVTVPDATPIISGTITLDAAQTSCDAATPNGELTVVASGGTGPYTYAWYPGTDTSDPNSIIATTANATGLSAQTYTVVITDQSNGCSEEVSYTLPSNIQLPDIDIDNIISNSVCNTSTGASFNGEIESSIGGVTGGYTFYWFDGDIASPDITSPDFIGATYSNLKSGDYTVVVVEDATTCESDRLVVTVPDATPTIGGTITLDAAQTSCDPTAPNGELTAAGSGGTTYTYDWYPGTDTSDPTDIIVSTANISGLGAQTYTVVITDQATGCQEEVSYALPSDIQLPAIDVDNIVPNSICDPALSTAADYDGEIEASVGGNTADYTFYWFDGDVASPDLTSADFTGSTYSNLPSGDYTVVVVEDATTCESNRLVVSVPDATPTIGGTITLDAAQTSCDPTAPNGELTAAGSGGTTYTYDWYPGTDTSDPTDIIVSTANISGLGAQTYTVVITDQATGCQEEVSYALPSDIQLPAIDVDNIVPNSICDPALSTAADYDGEIEASVGGNTADYTFYWFDGDVASPDLTSADFTGSTYSNLPSGDYTIVVVEDATTCASDRLVVTVPDATPTIGGTITLDAAQTSCDPTAPNGELTAAGSGGTTYTYEWYPGTDTSDPTDIIVSTANISGLGAQTFTVVITDQATGCQEEVSYAVPNDIKKPIINIDPNADITPNSICDPALATAMDYNGVIAANVTYDGAAITVADYRFDWYIGNDTSGAADFSSVGGNNYTNLAPGDYSLIVTRTNAGPGFQCSSEPITVTVPNNTTTPTATISKDAPQTSCGVPNGQLTAAGASGSGSYAYEWFVGTDTSTPFVDGTDGTISAVPGATISGIDAGNYTVRVTDLATGCQTVQDIYLVENIIDPVVEATVTTPFADCNTDVVITPTITSANAALNGHDFIWYEGQFASGASLVTTTDDAASPVLSEPNTGITIYSGYYTVVAQDRYTGCISEPYTLFVDRPVPQFDIFFDVNVEPSTCGVDEGVITAWIDLDGNANPSPAETDYSSYTFEWYLGNPTDLNSNFYTNPIATFSPNTALDNDQAGMYSGSSVPGVAGTEGTDYFAPSSSTNGATIFGLESGRYTVVVTNGSGCKEYLGIDLQFSTAARVRVADLDVTNNTNCSNPNGSILVKELENTPGARDTSDYDFYWYEGTNAGDTLVFDDEIRDFAGNVVKSPLLEWNGASGLAPGYYTVLPVERFGLECPAEPYTVFLDSAARQPVVTGGVLANSTSCKGNGIIDVAGDIGTGSAGGSNYSYSWFIGSDTSTPLIDGTDGTINSADDSILEDLSPGDYTVLVIDDDTDCSATKTFTILDQRVIPQISNITSVAQTYCNPNGTLTIDATEITPGTPDEYSYQVFLNGTDAADEVTASTTITAAAADVVFSGLEAGTYYISATRTTVGVGEGCTSGFIQEKVENELDPVVLTLSQTANTSCDPATNSDASIELTMSTPSSNGGISGATYNITVDNQPGTTLSDQVGVTSPFEYGADIVGNGEIVLPGSYTFTIQNTVSGCTTIRSITVEDNPEPIDFSQSNLLVRGAEYCIPSGSIIVDNILPADTSDYTYTWYAGKANYDAGTPIAGVTRSVLDSTKYPSIGAGVYYVVATRGSGIDPGSSCSSVGVRVEIPNAQETPALTLSQTANTACDADPNSDATLTLNMNTSSSTYAPIRDANYDIRFVSKPAGATVADTADINSTITFVSKPSRVITPGVYEIEITNRESKCTVTRSITVEDNPEPIDFGRDNLIVSGAQYCIPSGSIIVDNILPADTSDYTYTWYAGKANYDAGTPIGGVTRSVLDSTKYPGIGAGIYYVVATRGVGIDPGSSCSSVGVRVEIPNAQETPGLTLSQTANTACDADPNSDATITLNMNTSGSSYAPIRDANYDIRFVSKPAGATVADTTDINSTITFVSKPSRIITLGVYEIEITNRESKCTVTRSITVEDNPEPIDFGRDNLIVSGAQYCIPSGSIIVDNILPADTSDYTYTWYAGKANYDAGTPIAGVTRSVLDSTKYPGIGAGVYYVVATRGSGIDPGSSCSSVGVRVEIPNAQETPGLTLSQTANTACDADPNSDATITLNMNTSGSSYAPIRDANYDIRFVSKPAGATVADTTDINSTITFVSKPSRIITPGVYEIEITNRESKCTLTRSITVEDNPEPIDFGRNNLLVRGAEYCIPSGSIIVDNILPADTSDYTYTWYAGKSNYDAGTPIAGVTRSVLDSTKYPSIGAGVYYVVATRGVGIDPGSSCSSVGVRVEIPNAQVTPGLTLSQTANTACDADPNSDATITLNMNTSGSSYAPIRDANYDIRFVSTPAGATVADTLDINSTITFVSKPSRVITPGVYEIEITNRESKCTLTRSITVEDNPEPIDFGRNNLLVRGAEYCIPSGSIIVDNILPADTSDYTYTWYAGKSNYDAGTPIAGVTRSVLDSTKYPGIGAGVYYVVATRGVGIDPGSSCSSVGVRVEIPNAQVTPGLTLSQTANTACDADPNSDATITLNMNTSGSNYAPIRDANYDIRFVSKPAGATVADTLDINSTITFVSKPSRIITPGVYEIEITNRESKCTVTRSITVVDNPEPIDFSRSNLLVRGAEYCIPSGSIIVDNILPADTSDYTYTWYAGKSNYDAGTPIAGVTRSVLDSTKYPGIGAGVYYVVATRGVGIDPGSSCSSVGVRVEIPNAQVTPGLTLSQTANTACDADPNSDATITLNMNTSGSNYAPIRDANYDIRFVSTAAGATVADTTDINSTITFVSKPSRIITPGVYEIEITNRESKCTVTRSITVEDNPEPIILRKADLTVVNSTSCSASGNITVTNISPNTPSGLSDYSFTWYDGESNYISNSPIAGVTGTELDSSNYSSIHPGVYFVVATRDNGVNPGSSCKPNAVSVEILDAAISPDIVIVENAPNSSCDPANPNGSLSASVNGENLTDYTYEWFIGLNNTTDNVNATLISGVAGETVSGLAAGNYTVRVTDNTSPGEACVNTESFYLTEDFTISVAKNVIFDITPQSDCFDSGSISVASLIPGNPADFIYEWYYGTYDANGLISGQNSASISGRPAGTYYVMIRNSATECETETPIEVEIPFTATSPVIELLDAKPNTDCNPNTPDGFLEVGADFGQTAGYSFAWYDGEMPVNSGAVMIGNGNRINQLDSGYYSVVVQSSASNCSDTAQFYVEFLPELPKISLTTSPVTSCASANGSAYAQIYNLEGNFEFNWYIGNTISNQPDFTGPWQRDLPVGDYIVEAIDLDAPDCVSEPVSFSIEELIEVPQLKLNQISPNTYCDPEKVNGVAEVILYYVDEDDNTDTVFVTSDFEVLWYRETSFPEGTADFAGRINSQLAAADYTVTYRNVSSNCVWQDNITITEDLTVVPQPEVTITELFDSCEEPNGAAEISSSALNPNYVYRWYHEELNETPDFISNQVEELDLGIYLVTATDTVSGCISEPTEIEITDGRVAPEISLSLEPELCGEYNGKAIISINEDYEYRSIEWETPYGPAYGTSYDEFTSGQYSVTVTGNNGCQYTKNFTITSEINVFNGVSPNNDGENDVWEIGCIGGYEGNRVEIYNRAGALVFSTEGYGISSNDFEGYGNRGIYAGEKKLPDGTYYYVIIKGDGSEAVTGYLELFR